MASAAPAEAGTPIPGEELSGNDDAIDFEAEASKMGWTPLDQFKGDPSRHVDAETFYKRGQEMMPILKAQNKTLLRRLDAAEKAAKQAAEFFSQAEQRAYQRALADIRAEQEAAVEAGDVEAHRKASEKLDKLEKPGTPTPQAEDSEQRAKDFADWGKANKWYATNPVMQNYADSQAAILAKSKGGFLDRADLDAVAEKVREEFAEAFPDAFATEPAQRQKRPAVDGGGTRRGATGGKTYNDLPPEAKAACDKWVRQGLIKSREDYVKAYQWT
ncbi:hypothetical protein [Sphingobium chungbukense]|uniref:Uncharacterized protein n=1 Tax=Sphingobium chungbukense TaxID=56193 RepID=A0A0M3AS41_9SPHN|nr:hypothetical protein [Sphingobium chungbukense]KKW92675.1 hypothetical protein YP76_07005 [Sphingobium chungbukense]